MKKNLEALNMQRRLTASRLLRHQSDVQEVPDKTAEPIPVKRFKRRAVARLVVSTAG